MSKRTHQYKNEASLFSNDDLIRITLVWCAEMGYNSDDRHSKDSFNICRRELSNRLKTIGFIKKAISPVE